MNTSEKFVITINRELGSGGKTVAKKLAEKLGVPYYDKAHLQSMEDKKFEVADRIRLTIAADGDLAAAATAHRQTIADETLAVELTVVPAADAPAATTPADIASTPCFLSLAKAGNL